MNWWLKWEWKNDNRASIMSFALQKCMAVCSWVSACSSTFFARRCVYSTQCVRGWVRKLLQLSLSPLWSLLSWRVWDNRVSHTWDTELLLGSFLSVVMHKQEKKIQKDTNFEDWNELLCSLARYVQCAITSLSLMWTFLLVFPGNEHTRFQSHPVDAGSLSGLAAVGSFAQVASPILSVGLQADSEPLKGRKRHTYCDK